MNSKIFFRRMTAVFTVKTQRKRISSHLKNGTPTKPIRYKLVLHAKRVLLTRLSLLLRDLLSKIAFKIALKSTSAFEIIRWVMFSLLRCLLLLSPSWLLALNFKSAFLLQRSVGGKSSPARIDSRLLNSGFLCLLFCFICMRNRLRFADSKRMKKQVSSHE